MMLITVTALVTSGCDTVKGAFGLDHYQADEFNITQNPPLSLPPCYNLEPPAKGAIDQAGDAKSKMAEKQAQNLLIGKKEKADDSSSVAAKDVVKAAERAQETPVDPKIRQMVDQEADQSKAEDTIGSKLSKIGDTIAQNAKRTSNDPVTAEGK